MLLLFGISRGKGMWFQRKFSLSTSAGAGPKILILGAGIIGLTTAKVLKESLKCSVIVYSDRLVKDTTSAGAGGLWLPYHCEPIDLVNKWGYQTYDKYHSRWSKGDPLVERMKMIDLLKNPPSSDHQPWSNGLEDKYGVEFGKTAFLENVFVSDEIRIKYPNYWSFNCFVVDSPNELSSLENDLFQSKEDEILVNQPSLTSVEDISCLANDLNCDIIINCTGLGSKDILSDNAIFPAKGIIKVYQRPEKLSYTLFLEEEEDNDTKPNYIIPRGEVVVVGGTFYENDNTQGISPEDDERLLANASGLCTLLNGSGSHWSWEGFRPYRGSGVRFDRIRVGDRFMINNYGHGGSGWTLAYGAAVANARAVQDIVAAH